VSEPRQRVSSGSPYESQIGFSRAVRVGGIIHVAGTAPVMPDGAPPPADPYLQAKRCLEIIANALAEAGAGLDHVVRTRIYAVRREDYANIGRAHAEAFGESRPASTFVVVGLLDPRWAVEIEADAIVG
jgi:enamine deaminase RidA (YjgF/YER057c/UK114 family)